MKKFLTLCSATLGAFLLFFLGPITGTAAAAAPTGHASTATTIDVTSPDRVTQKAVANCDGHFLATIAQYTGNGNEVSFRVTGNDLYGYLGYAGQGLVYVTVYDSEGSHGAGAFPASTDLGANFPLSANVNSADSLSVTVDLTTSDNSSTICSTTFFVTVQYIN